MKNSRYRVLWTRYARIALARMYSFKVDPKYVFQRSKNLLASLPEKKAYGISEFPEFTFNGFFWTLIGNVVLIYKVDHSLLEVHVYACYYANSGKSHHIFWGIDPEDE